MRKLFVALIAFALCISPLMAEKAPSVAQKKELVFWGKGFALTNGIQNFQPLDLSIHKVFSADLKKPPSEAEVVIVAKLLIAKTAYPVRIISPKLEAFEADIMDANVTEDVKKVPIPIGHITLKVAGDVGVGKLKIQIEDQKDLSGQFDVLLNDITDLMRVFEVAMARKSE